VGETVDVCGRYVSSGSSADLARAFDVDDVVGEDLPPSWNVAPTQRVRVALERVERDEEPVRQLRTVRWGLVPADGHYEWQTADGRKTPDLLTPAHPRVEHSDTTS
jgi:putative SOS response-associated peptidase YedK